jgi:hypothetical protein
MHLHVQMTFWLTPNSLRDSDVSPKQKITEE